MVKKLFTNCYKTCSKWYESQLMIPGIFGVFVNPFFKVRKDLYTYILKYSSQIDGRILDFGCGSKPYRKFFNVSEYVGLDIEGGGHVGNKSVDVFYDGNHIPFEDSYFDNVFSSETLEHVFNIDQVLDEINRVIKKNGLFLFSIPFVWDEHEQPYDCARYTSFGIKSLLAQHGFDLVSIDKSGSYVDTIFQMWCTYLYKVFFSKYIFVNLLVQLIIISPFMIIGLSLSHLLPKNYDFYNNLIVLSKKR